MTIKERILKVQEEIEKHCEVALRNPEEVTLIAVSKTKPLPLLQEAYAAGQRHFGENRVQELLDKYDQMPRDVQWHLIGHLQTNKVKYIVDKVALIHSVDSLKLAQEISKEAVKKQVTVKVLLEVNISEEESKFGFTKEEVVVALPQIAALPGIQVEGFMTVAPICEQSEENRGYFRQMKQLLVDTNGKNIDNVKVSALSMGMTNDYDVAIEEGASYIRVGTGIFGER